MLHCFCSIEPNYGVLFDLEKSNFM